MPKFKLEMLFYTLYAIGFSLIIGSNLTHCQSEPIPTSGQPSLPAQDNFEHEKLWTEADFKAAEIDPLDINHAVIEPHLPPPDDITEDDLANITSHNRKQLQRLTAGAREWKH